MDNALFDLVNKEMPKVNEDVVNGLAVKEINFAAQYVDNIVRCAQEIFPEGLIYKGYKKLTPLEEFLRVTEPKSSNKSIFDVARSDFYMIALEFEFKGERLIKPLYLPFCRDGGIISIRGATFAISPVLADKGISITSNSVFVQIPKSKMTFKRLRHHFLANGGRRSPNVVYSWLHNRNRKANNGVGKPLVSMNTALVHYLFAKYGVRETFKRFCDIDIVIGEEDITEDKYPKDQWVICSSMGLKPRGVKAKVYSPTKVKVAVRECDFDTITETMVGGFFYILDHFPNRIAAEFIDDSKHEIHMWRILLGLIIGGITGGEGAVRKGMDEHMGSLDSYIDPVAKDFLQQGDIFVDDIYQLLYHVIELLSGMVVQPTESNASIYDKQLLVLRYILQDINDGIFRMLFSLKNTESKKPLTFDIVRNALRKSPQTDVISKMTSHGEVNSISSPGDNKFFKVTSNLILQTDSGSSPKGAKSTGVDSSKFLHASIAEVGSYLVLPKSEPTGRSRINPYLVINRDGFIERDPLKKPLLDEAQRKFNRD